MTNLLCKENDYYSSPKASSIEQSCVGSISTISKHIEDINRNYFKEDEFYCYKKRETIVRFCDKTLNMIIEEPEDLIEDLAMARMSDFKKRQADKERMERLMKPVLSKVHREKVYNERILAVCVCKRMKKNGK